MSLEKYLPKVKPYIDSSSSYEKHFQWTESSSVGPGDRIRFTLANFDALDVSSIRLHFNYRAIHKNNVGLFGVDMADVIDRVVFKNQGNVFYDSGSLGGSIQSINNILHMVTREAAPRRPKRTLRAEGFITDYDERKDAAFADERVSVRLPLPGSVFDTAVSLPMAKLGRMEVEIFLAQPGVIMYDPDSGTDPDPNMKYSLTNVQLHCTYLKSKALESALSQRPLAWNIAGYHHRTAPLDSLKGQINIPTSFKSLRAILITCRKNDINSLHWVNPARSFEPLDFEQFQLSVNSTNVFETPIQKYDQHLQWRKQRRLVFGDAADYVESQYDELERVYAVSLDAFPAITSSVVSGANTTQHTNSVIMTYAISSIPVDTHLEFFLVTDELIRFSPQKNSLELIQ